MKPEFNDQVPIFIQIANMIKDDLVEGTINEGDQLISTTDLSNFYNINRATAQKGIGILVDEGIVEKRRGIGIFVVPNARATLIEARMKNFTDAHVRILVKEAKRLGISKEELMERVRKGYDIH